MAPDHSYIGDSRRTGDGISVIFVIPSRSSPGVDHAEFPLSEQQLNDLTSYMLSLRRMDAGRE